VLRNRYREFLENECESDSSHDIAHVKRVVAAAVRIAAEEKADIQVVEAAAWLHDCVILSKNHPQREQASVLASQKAGRFLKTIPFPNEKIEGVVHAIQAHSFSADIAPVTAEAEIVQDADRLDALGAIGIARCLSVGGQLNRTLYNPDDPLCETRKPDDQTYTVDHFFQKLFELPEQMNTQSAKREADRRVQFMKEYLARLKEEVTI
jgi:uncharacterized protein